MTAIEQQGCSSPYCANVTFEAVAVSPGGPKALNAMLAGLPTDSPASVLVVPRLCPDRPSLPATFSTPVADRHLLVRPDATVSQAKRVRFVRPLCDISRALRTMAAALGGW